MRFRFTLKHQLSAEALQFSNNSFELTINGWDQIVGSDTAFVWNNPSSARASGATSDTAAIGQDRPDDPSKPWRAGTYTVEITATNTSTGGSAPLTSALEVYGSDTGSALDDFISYSGTGTWDVGAGEIAREITFTLAQEYNHIFFKFVKQGVSAGYNVVFTINSIELIRVQDATDDQEISEPDGWKGAKIILDRDPDFCSLIERYEGSAGGAFIFYGENGEENGGINFIKEVEQSYGLDENISFISEYAPDDVNYNDIFDGLLEITGKNERKDNKMQVPVVPDDLWTKFIARMGTPINLSDLFDLDGNPVDPVVPITVNLTSQKVRYNGEYTWNETVHYPNPSGDGKIQVDWDTTVIDDIQKFSLPRVDVSGTPFNLIPGIFEAPYDGVYTFDIRIESGSFFGGSWQNALAEPRFRIGNSGGDAETNYRIFTANSIDNGAGQFLWVHTFNDSFLLAKGQQISIFAVTDSSAGTTTVFGERINNWLADAHAATTAAITLSGTQTIDNYAAVAGNRILVKNQGDQTENGVYVVAAGAWSRSTDADSSAELQDATVLVLNGDVNGTTYWIQATEDVVLGTTTITFRTTGYNETKLVPYPGTGTPDNHLIVTADTTFKETTAQGYLIHDLIHGVLARMGLGSNPFYSEFLGSTLTNSRVYASDGCGWMYAIIKGLQIRGYTLTEKPFFSSFKQIWDGINPILNLGLGYEVVSNTQVIRIEEKEHFYDDTIAVNFSNVREISASYDQSMIFKTIKTGFKVWESEDISGNDDPQTKHTYATRFKKSGKEINLESDFIAAGIATETARRITKDKSTDYKHDNNNFIIALNENDVSADVYVPELNENFDSVTGLLNPDARYNLILTPMRSLLRWANYLGGCLQSYTNSVYKFVSGEGNYDMVSDYACGSGNECQAIICDSLGESQDISLATYNAGFGYLHLPLVYDIVIPMELDEFQAIDRKKAIGISQTTADFVAFKIKLLEYDIVKGEAVIKAWPKTSFPINVITEYNMSTCDPPVPVPAPFDSDYQAILDYGTLQGYSLPSSIQQILQNQLVLDLKSAGIWSDLDILYVFATNGDSDFAKINWRSPGNFTATEVSTPAFTADEGFTGNGSNAYLDTGWDPSTNGVNYTQNEAGWFIKIGNSIAGESRFAFGCSNASNVGLTRMNPRTTIDTVSYFINGLGFEVSNTDSKGFYHGYRLTDDRILFKDGVEIANSPTASNGISSQDISILAFNNNGTIGSYSNAQVSFFGMGASLSGNESALYTAWNTYFTSL